MPISFLNFIRKYTGAGGKKGTTLVETLIYIFVLVFLLIIVIDALVSFSRSLRLLQTNRDIENSAITAVERVTREIRDAKSIDIDGSLLNISPGKLLLNTTGADGTAKTIQFFVQDQVLRVKENGADAGALTRSSAKVTSLLFQQIVASSSQAVKITMTLESGVGAGYKQATFYDTAALRGSYPVQ